MRRLVLILILIFLVMVSVANAEQNEFCDPIPENLAALLDDTPLDCIVFDAPDGTKHAYLTSGYGLNLTGYRYAGGAWENVVGHVDELNGSRVVELIRHSTDQMLPDGSYYNDCQGFDVKGADGSYNSYHWNGEYYSLCGWYDPNAYSGRVMIRGTAVLYYPDGSTTPEYETDTKDEITLYSWTGMSQFRPETPEEARKRTAILLSSIGDDIPGSEPVSYSPYNSGTEAEVVFASIVYDKLSNKYILQTVKAVYDIERETPETKVLVDVPIDANLKDVPVKTLWENRKELLTQPGAIDTEYIPVHGKIIDFSICPDYLLMLIEEEGKRRVAIAYQETATRYTVVESGILPPDSCLDTFHSGDNRIILEFNHQEWGAGFRRTNSGWLLDWVMGEAEDYITYTTNRWRIHYYRNDNDGTSGEGLLIGTVRNNDLSTIDFTTIPRTLEELEQSVDRQPWAVVNNPDPQDRLHLRPESGNRERSLGKFYNGTPVTVLETEEEWARVKIGQDGPEGWMMKKYLAFGNEMDQVEPAFPYMELLPEYRDQVAWTNPEKTAFHGLLGDCEWYIMGILEDRYILVNDEGYCAYAMTEWFGEGNG